MLAIINLLQYIKNNIQQINCIYIFVDSLSVLQFIKGDNYPKYNNIKKLIQQIFILIKYIHLINKINIIYFKKVRSHSNEINNELVDKLAKFAAFTNILDPNLSYIPYSVTIFQLKSIYISMKVRKIDQIKHVTFIK